ncbi:MAG: sodium-dependent phosphate cotransporter [Patescibacteria group bacterium]|jgi:sodium-dependent phosphate cotransporter
MVEKVSSGRSKSSIRSPVRKAKKMSVKIPHLEEPKSRTRSAILLVVFLYIFVLSLELIKKASSLIPIDISTLIFESIAPVKAISLGWFVTTIAQSSGAVSSVVVAFVGEGLITLPTGVYIMIGASLGTTITALIISLVTVSVKRKDFRHGFEIALAYSIYSALLVFIVAFLEYFFALFSRVSLYLATLFEGGISLLFLPDFVTLLTDPVLHIIFVNSNVYLLFLLAFIGLGVSLKFMSTSLIDVFGGREKARIFMNKHFDNKYKAYFLGVLLTAMVFSSSITISLLVPLAVARLISLRKAIPFILGADLGTVVDTILAALIVGEVSAVAAAIAYGLFAVVGALIFLPNVEFLNKVTKYISKRFIVISRDKAFYILIAFILIPLAILLFF